MNERYEQMKSLLDSGQYFKLVCGAGNEDAEEVRRLTIVYTLGGGNGLDISATPEVVSACISGIDRAYELAPRLGREIPVRPFVTVSVGMGGDHHVRKAIIVDDCVECGKCIPVCPTEAIPDSYEVIREKCIGCGNCEAACPPKVAAVRYEHNAKELQKILPKCISLGAENIELHAAVADNDSIMEEWKTVCEAQPNNFVSMCLDRLHLSNSHLAERIQQAKEMAGDRLIIQADGVPMSGGADDFNTTLQAIAIADIINKDLRQKNKKFANLPMLLSGGTNGRTRELAELCGVPFAGVSIGTHARKIVKEYIQRDDFDSNLESLKQAVAIAQDLVRASLRT
jgi:ferredoxin